MTALLQLLLPVWTMLTLRAESLLRQAPKRKICEDSKPADASGSVMLHLHGMQGEQQCCQNTSVKHVNTDTKAGISMHRDPRRGRKRRIDASDDSTHWLIESTRARSWAISWRAAGSPAGGKGGEETRAPTPKPTAKSAAAASGWSKRLHPAAD